MTRWIVPLVSGVLFACGLALAGMTRPAKVFAFLDLTGAWDPSLAFVMIGAIGVHTVAYVAMRRLDRPWTGETFQVPTRRDVDARLLAGAALFGVGWGISGFCPGPALAALGSGSWQVLVFFAAMLAGMVGYEVIGKPRAS